MSGPISKNSFRKSLLAAFRGIIIAGNERNIRIHLIAAVLVTIAGFILKISLTKWMIILILFAVVISAELINSALERLANLVEPNVNSHIRDLKDIAAGAVLLTSIVSVIIGIIIFAPEILKFFKNIPFH
ncbi:MAG: diacylglycerol kinase family protein [Bacteroidales bacterium]|nr:diacylglycerol kinase family protein [Bacteroidales bacterium]